MLVRVDRPGGGVLGRDLRVLKHGVLGRLGICRLVLRTITLQYHTACVHQMLLLLVVCAYV